MKTRELTVTFGIEYPEGVRIYPKDLNLTRTQFQELKKVPKIPGFIMFPNGKDEAWVRQTHYASDKGKQSVVEEIKEGWKILNMKAEELNAGLNKNPEALLFTYTPGSVSIRYLD